jgi:hypothetical protein
MKLSRSYDRLVSLTISTMLTSAFLATAPDNVVSAAAGPAAAIQNILGGAGAAGFSGMKNIAAIVPPATPPSSGNSTRVRPISDAQFQKILIDARANGKDIPTSTDVTTAFGLSHKGETLTLRHDGFRDAAQKHHGITILPNGNYFFALKETETSHVYYVDKNLFLIAALINSVKDGITILPNKDAQEGLNAELAYFAMVADKL